MLYSSPELQQAESAMHSVLESLSDSQEALVEIGEKLHDMSLRHFLLAESLRRAQFRSDLERVLNEEGVSDIREGSASAGSVHRVWSKLKSGLVKSIMGSTIIDASDHALLVTAELVEDAARESYEYALTTPLPAILRELLCTQAQHIEMSHDILMTARDHSSEHSNHTRVHAA